ncbi:acetate--CoA ligase family protein [Geodermatophilus sp. DSM 44513]|uniref:acetate--CoA ligase family protein n=1 Tax=Geodermatophilus sp. DSM 44513 TaxID=1528104 RepID=UPI00126B1034|nr:acetate--CoA ligase family protein [Geodermatophilus sp. DSM 44513]WNV74185.1 acetate--CoA ligase family protein [Geodermatophilus sp. DSM 44513]
MPHQALPPAQVAALLGSAGVSLARSASVDDVAGVGAAFAELGAAPVVLKAGGLLHKTDAGGVVLGLRSAAAVVDTAEDMVARLGPQAYPLVLQEQVRGLEILVGARRDPQLGAAVVVGLGGVATEVHDDIVTTMAPLDRDEARAALRQLRAWPLLDGFRGEPGRDLEALVDTVVAVSRLVEQDEAIVELDLNPVMVGHAGQGVAVVDARVIRTDEPPPAERASYDLDRMLRPRHVVVVGVSDDPHKVGARLFRYLDDHGFPGRLDAVHPSGGEVRGRRRHTSLAEVEGSPDLVCITVPGRHVLDVARQAVDKQVGGVIVHSSDFAEVGEEGRAAQEELARVLREGGVPLAGPNDMGVVAPFRRLTASISGGLEEDLVQGGVALLSSSGALGSCLGTRLMGERVGLSYWIHAGNEADLVIADYLEWLARDEDTRSVALLLEDVKDGSRFIAAGRRMAAAGKPMFAYNAVRSDRGRAAALSHTGAMVGSFAVREAVVRAAGMVSVPSLRVLEDAVALAALEPLPAGDRLVAVTFSGGACSIIADEGEAAGIQLPELSEATREAVRPHLPSYAAVRNPLDCSYQMITQPDAFEELITALTERGEYDALLLQFTTNADPYAAKIAEKVVAMRDRLDIPLYVSRYGGAQLAPQALEVYRDNAVHVLDAPDRATLAVAAVMAGARALRAHGAGAAR